MTFTPRAAMAVMAENPVILAHDRGLSMVKTSSLPNVKTHPTRILQLHQIALSEINYADDAAEAPQSLSVDL